MQTRGYYVVTLLVWLLCFWTECPSVLGVQCFVCYSTKSWDDCNINVLSKNCSDTPPQLHLNVCQKYYYTSLDGDGKKTDHYIKTCGMSVDCGYDGCDCPMQCCSTDLCNGTAMMLEFSRIMLAMCALRQLIL